MVDAGRRLEDRLRLRARPRREKSRGEALGELKNTDAIALRTSSRAVHILYIEGGQGLPHEVEPRYRKLKIRHIRREKKTAPLARRVHAPACTKDSTVAL